MNVKDWQRGRDDGLALALRIGREGGADALEKEVKARGAMGLKTSLTMKELDDAGIVYKENAVDTVLAMAVEVLHDEFGFGTERLQRFVNRIRFKASCLGAFVKWRDIQDNIREKFKLKNVTIRNLDELDSVWKSRDAG